MGEFSKENPLQRRGPGASLSDAGTDLARWLSAKSLPCKFFLRLQGTCRILLAYQLSSGGCSMRIPYHAARNSDSILALCAPQKALQLGCGSSTQGIDHCPLACRKKKTQRPNASHFPAQPFQTLPYLTVGSVPRGCLAASWHIVYLTSLFSRSAG